MSFCPQDDIHAQATPPRCCLSCIHDLLPCSLVHCYVFLLMSPQDGIHAQATPPKCSLNYMYHLLPCSLARCYHFFSFSFSCFFCFVLFVPLFSFKLALFIYLLSKLMSPQGGIHAQATPPKCCLIHLYCLSYLCSYSCHHRISMFSFLFFRVFFFVQYLFLSVYFRKICPHRMAFTRRRRHLSPLGRV